MDKVLPGQRLKIPARTFNTMIDAAEAFQRSRLNRGSDALPSTESNGIITVCNQTGADQSRFAVLGLDSPVVLPSENLLEFQNRWAMNVVIPGDEHAEAFCILLEPIADGEFGHAMVVGAVPVLIYRDAGVVATYAGIVAGETVLTAGVRGANILWEDPGAADGTSRWALVQIPQSFDDSTAIVATTASITRSGLQTIDGVALQAGDLVLVKNNSSDNGLYRVESGAWTQMSVPDYCVIQEGTVWAGSTFVLDATGAYVRAKVPTSSAKAAQSSGAPATPADGITLAAGDRLLVLTGTSAGLYTYTGSAFVSLGQPLSVDVTSGSTNGTKTFFLTAANTYTAPAVGTGTGDVMGVKAADVTVGTSMDGQTIASGDKVLKVSGTGTGVYSYNGTSFTFVAQASAVAVRMGTARGRQLWLLDGSGVYQPGFAVYA